MLKIDHLKYVGLHVFFIYNILQSAWNFQGSDSDFDDKHVSDEDTNEPPSLLAGFDIPMEAQTLGFHFKYPHYPFPFLIHPLPLRWTRTAWFHALVIDLRSD